MKKQNILDLLCNDLESQYNKEQTNKKEVLKNTEEEINLCHHINLFLTNNYKIYNLDFDYDIKSNNELYKAKSLYLLDRCINSTIILIGINPDFLKSYQSKYNKSLTFDELCFRVLLGNILEYKKELKQINDNNSNNIIKSYQELYNLLLNTKYKPYN